MTGAVAAGAIATDVAPPGAGPGAAAATFEEDPARGSNGDRSAAPLLRLAAFEGRLDWLLELARARRVDLARLSLVEVADQLLAALDEAAALAERDGEAGHGLGGAAASLLRRGEWVTMGAALAELRTRLLLPEDSVAGRQAREEACALREQLVERERVLAAADWLDGRIQLGRDVFARGAPTLGAAARGRTPDLTALLRACLAVLQAEVARGERYRPRPPAIWPVRQALARLQALLPGLLGAAAGPDGAASLWRFLPDDECLASAGLAGEAVPDPALLRHSMVASTFVAGLELAREGHLTLAQEELFGDVQVRGAAIRGEGTPGCGGASDTWSK